MTEIPKSALILFENAKKAYDQGNTAKCLQNLKNLVHIAEGDLRIQVFDLLAKLCVDKHEVNKAITLYKNSLNHVAADNWIGQANIYNKIGLLEQARKNLEEALKNQKLCLEAVEKTGNQRSLSITLRNLGRLYTLMGKNVEALRAHQRSLELKRTIGDRREVALENEDYAQGLEYERDFKNAIEEYSKAKQIYEEMGLRPEVERIDELISRVKTEMDEETRFDEEEMFVLKSRNAF